MMADRNNRCFKLMKLKIFLHFLGNSHDAWFEHSPTDKYSAMRGKEALGYLIRSKQEEFQRLTGLTIRCRYTRADSVAFLDGQPELKGCCGGRDESSMNHAVGGPLLDNYERFMELGVEITILPQGEMLRFLTRRKRFSLKNKKAAIHRSQPKV